jgi:hypothetical protein
LRDASELVTEQRLQWALCVVAEIVADDPTYMPLLDRLSAELQALKNKRAQLQELLLPLVESPTIDAVVTKRDDAAA